MPEHGLGRLIHKDPRDHGYLLSRPEVAPEREYRVWYDQAWWGDQGATPQCVGFAWAHFLEDAPDMHYEPGPIVNPTAIYMGAQKVDAWPGENYDGTTVRAGAKYLKNMKVISAYHWAFDVDTIARNVMEVGPVVLGTDFYDSMFDPDPKNGRWHIDGPLVGGHAYVCNGYSMKTKRFRIKNSWGKSWGLQGRAYISADDLQTLMEHDGEACLATERG